MTLNKFSVTIFKALPIFKNFLLNKKYKIKLTTNKVINIILE